MGKIYLFFYTIIIVTFTGCIGIDILNDKVEPTLELTTVKNIIVTNTTFQFEAKYRANSGVVDNSADIIWETSDVSVATITSDGLLTAVNEGTTLVSISFAIDTFNLYDEVLITVVSEVDPEIIFSTFIDTLGIGNSFQFDAKYFNKDGLEETAILNWQSSDTTTATVNNNGLVSGLKLGSVDITAAYDNGVSLVQATQSLTIADQTVIMQNQKTGTINTTSSYILQGDFVLKEEQSGNLTLSFGSDYKADTGLPGLYIYLTNNKNSSAPSVAYEIGAVSVFTGSHSYSLPPSIGIDDYQYVLYFCKPFSVKVGDGIIN